MTRSQGDGWYAAPSNGDMDDEWTVGPRIRVMAEAGGGLPLWDDEGRLPEEPEFLHGYLGLTSELVDDLRSWADAIEENSVIDMGAVTDEGERLRERLQRELGDAFEVTLVLPRWAEDPR